MNIRMPRLSDLDRLFRRRRLERSLARHLPRLPGGPAKVVVSSAAPSELPHRYLLRKDGRRLIVALDHRRLLRHDWIFRIFRLRCAVQIDAFARTGPGVVEAPADISDGRESGPGIISFCSTDRDAVLVPDCDFYGSAGYADFRVAGAAPGPGWAARDAAIVWRGSSTGRGIIANDDMTVDDARLIQRTRLCLALRGVPGVDARLQNAVQSPDPARDLARLRAAELLGDPVDALSWRRRKFALDVDGNSNAWSNLFTRLLLGCCVIKIGSRFGFRQWYYDDLRPFEHFVPVAADLSDLGEKIEWCRSHDRECAAIAAAGQAFARARTLQSEMTLAVTTLNRAFGGRQA